MFSGSPTMSSVLFRSRFVFQPLIGAALVIGTGVTLISPVSAATFASSQAIVTFSEFRVRSVIDDSISELEPVETNAQVDTDGDLESPLGSSTDLITVNKALGSFLGTGAFNQVSSTSQGTKGIYEGLGTSSAELIGIFKIAEKNSFEFDLKALLRVNSGVGDPGQEEAEAFASISLLLEDITNPNAPITLNKAFWAGGSENNNSASFLSSITSGFNLTTRTTANATFIEGSYSRRFDTATTLRLTEVKLSSAAVKALEPNAVPTPVLLPGLLGFGSSLWRKRQKLTAA
jgi:hypothetical protein